VRLSLIVYDFFQNHLLKSNIIFFCSANALTDLLQGRQIQQLEPYLQDLWNMSFRALDDIKVCI
jgi:hypothetical protein